MVLMGWWMAVVEGKKDEKGELSMLVALVGECAVLFQLVIVQLAEARISVQRCGPQGEI